MTKPAEKYRCTLFYCDKRGERLCCACCQSRGRCKNLCLNHPSRCGLAEAGARKAGRESAD